MTMVHMANELADEILPEIYQLLPLPKPLPRRAWLGSALRPGHLLASRPKLGDLHESLSLAAGKPCAMGERREAD